jgi:hypothetical protein
MHTPASLALPPSPLTRAQIGACAISLRQLLQAEPWSFQLELYKNGLPRGIVSGCMHISQTAGLPTAGDGRCEADGYAEGEEDTEAASLGRSFSRFRRGTSVYRSAVLVDEDGEEEAEEGEEGEEGAEEEEEEGLGDEHLLDLGAPGADQRAVKITIVSPIVEGEGPEVEESPSMRPGNPALLAVSGRARLQSRLSISSDSRSRCSSLAASDVDESDGACGEGRDFYPFSPHSAGGSNTYLTISGSPKYRERLRSIRRKPRPERPPELDAGPVEQTQPDAAAAAAQAPALPASVAATPAKHVRRVTSV